MLTQELLELNAKGFIPGPGETEGSFLARVNTTQELFAKESSLPKAHWEWVHLQIKELFGFKPESLIAFYSNKGLTLWQGAACWIGEDLVPKLQLRDGFRKGRYLGLYSREETLAHEAVHAARSAFNEPENEEFFAYCTSEKKWRRVLGPIVRRPWEVWVLWGTFLTTFFTEWGFITTFFWISLGLIRLARGHLRRAKASRTLMKNIQEKAIVRAVLFRLTDLEIRQLAKGQQLQGDDTLRWRMIRAAYNGAIYGEKN